jgi:hypothetical protein
MSNFAFLQTIRSLSQSDGNVKQHFYITENGCAYLELRQQVDEKE